MEINYRESKLADQLVKYLVVDLVKDALANPIRELRIKAVEKLGQWGSERLEIGVLQRMVETEPDLRIRAAATAALRQIKSRV